jgi:hypothetical protein
LPLESFLPEGEFLVFPLAEYPGQHFILNGELMIFLF